MNAVVILNENDLEAMAALLRAVRRRRVSTAALRAYQRLIRCGYRPVTAVRVAFTRGLVVGGAL